MTTTATDPYARLAAELERDSGHAHEMFAVLGKSPADSIAQHWRPNDTVDWDLVSIPQDDIRGLTDRARAVEANNPGPLAGVAAWDVAKTIMANIEGATALVSSTNQQPSTGRGAHARPGALTRAIAHGLETVRHLAIRASQRVTNAASHDPAHRSAAHELRRFSVAVCSALDKLMGGDGSAAPQHSMIDVQRYADQEHAMLQWDTHVPAPEDRPYGMFTDDQLLHQHAIEIRSANAADEARIKAREGTLAAAAADLQRGLETFSADPVLAESLRAADPSEARLATELIHRKAGSVHDANAMAIRTELATRTSMSGYRSAVETARRNAAIRTQAAAPQISTSLGRGQVLAPPDARTLAPHM